jgi:hypothetical protein
MQYGDLEHSSVLAVNRWLRESRQVAVYRNIQLAAGEDLADEGICEPVGVDNAALRGESSASGIERSETSMDKIAGFAVCWHMQRIGQEVTEPLLRKPIP